jgi:hypothetical protein
MKLYFQIAYYEMFIVPCLVYYNCLDKIIMEIAYPTDRLASSFDSSGELEPEETDNVETQEEDLDCEKKDQNIPKEPKSPETWVFQRYFSSHDVC